jgi:hypothetical protein
LCQYDDTFIFVAVLLITDERMSRDETVRHPARLPRPESGGTTAALQQRAVRGRGKTGARAPDQAACGSNDRPGWLAKNWEWRLRTRSWERGATYCGRNWAAPLPARHQAVPGKNFLQVNCAESG